MACNFNIMIHRNSDNLHLKLSGDFDGSSAWELLNAVKENNHGAERVFIHTNGLRTVHPFGACVFWNHLREAFSADMNLILTGEKREELGPQSEIAIRDVQFGTED